MSSCLAISTMAISTEGNGQSTNTDSRVPDAKGWWAHQDSNLERAGYEPAALTVELWARSILRRPAFKKRTKFTATGRMPQLAQRFRFDLTNAFAGHREA